MGLPLLVYTMAPVQRSLGWGAQVFDAPVLPALLDPGVKSPKQRVVREEGEMGPVTAAAVVPQETGMREIARWESQTPGRAVHPSLSAGFSSVMANVIHSVTPKSACLMAMTARRQLPALLPTTNTAEITSTMDTARRAATPRNVVGMGVTAGPETTEMQSGGPLWPC